VAERIPTRGESLSHTGASKIKLVAERKFRRDYLSDTAPGFEVLASG